MNDTYSNDNTHVNSNETTNYELKLLTRSVRLSKLNTDETELII